MVRDYIAKRSGLICYQTGSGLAVDLAEPVVLATTIARWFIPEYTKVKYV